MAGLGDRDQAHRFLAQEPGLVAERLRVDGRVAQAVSPSSSSGTCPSTGGGAREQRIRSG